MQLNLYSIDKKPNYMRTYSPHPTFRIHYIQLKCCLCTNDSENPLHGSPYSLYNIFPLYNSIYGRQNNHTIFHSAYCKNFTWKSINASAEYCLSHKYTLRSNDTQPNKNQNSKQKEELVKSHFSDLGRTNID